jgi:hypothetical protein
LQFTFTGLESANSFGSPWTDSDFTFTVLSNGFGLSGPPAQNITAPGVDYAQLDYDVTNLTGSIYYVTEFNGNAVGGSGLTSHAFSAIYLCSNGCLQELAAFTGGGYAGSIYADANGEPISSGYGAATPFDLDVIGCCTSFIGGTTTDFTFSTNEGTPEPRLVVLLSVGVLGLLCARRGKLRR